jgi:hypothetical protein
MKRNPTNPKSSTIAGALALASAALLSLGCASNPNAKGTVDAMGSFGIEMAKGKDSIDSAVRALDALPVGSPDGLKSRYQTYTKSFDALDAQAKIVREHADKMKSEGDAYFKAWEGNKTPAAERQAELGASYAKIKEEMAAAKEGFAPFFASLKDINSYLSLDLSPKGLETVAPLIAKAKDNGANVKTRLDAVMTQVNSVRGMLETKAR